jgi:transcriptional regulator with XRE-family HTH domain
VAAAVAAAIAQAGITYQAVAKGTGIPQATLHRKLNEHVSFNVRELDQIANYLGVPVEQLTAPARNAA